MDLFIRIFLFHIVLSVSCSLVVTCSKRADLLALLCLTFCCDCVTFPYGVLGRVWNLIVSIPELCLLPYFVGMQGLYKKGMEAVGVTDYTKQAHHKCCGHKYLSSACCGHKYIGK